MGDNAPIATIAINEAIEQREVCGVRLRTRGDDGNTVTLAGGVDLKVDDEYAAAVIQEYIENALEERNDG
jgi:hypothetical protein